jgi:hypothetical protein
MRSGVAYYSRAWGTKLTEEQRQRWNIAGGKVPTETRCGHAGFQTGEQHYVGINAARWCINLNGFAEPPEPIILPPNPVGGLSIIMGEKGVRLLLTVTGPVTEDIMLFGQAPCSAGRSKRRNVSYLGLMPAPTGGVTDITDLYVARYGAPPPGTKVFIVTRQQKNGWEGQDNEASDIVPGTPAVQPVPAQPALTLQPHMPKGCPRDAQEIAQTLVPGPQDGTEVGRRSAQAAEATKAPQGGEEIPPPGGWRGQVRA